MTKFGLSRLRLCTTWQGLGASHQLWGSRRPEFGISPRRHRRPCSDASQTIGASKFLNTASDSRRLLANAGNAARCPILIERGPQWAEYSHRCDHDRRLVDHGPNLVDRGPHLPGVVLNFAELGPNLFELDQGLNLVELGHNLGQSWPDSAPNLAHFGPNLSKRWPSSVDLAPSSVNIEPISAELVPNGVISKRGSAPIGPTLLSVAPGWPNSARIMTTPTEFDPDSAKFEAVQTVRTRHTGDTISRQSSRCRTPMLLVVWSRCRLRPFRSRHVADHLKQDLWQRRRR